MLKHNIAETILYHDGKPLSLKRYKLFHPFYDLDCQKILYKTGRQVAKSTTLALTILLSCIFRAYYKVLYTAPLEGQVNKFSNLYISPIVSQSPMVKSLQDIDSVMLKTFTNGSRIQFTYTANTTKNIERYRGISADEICWDEIQDTSYNIMPVLEQCIPTVSKYQLQKYCGTPKTLENSIEYLWQRSSQNEWEMKCEHCNTLNIPDLPNVLEMISKTGPVCYKCKKSIDVTKGQWISINSNKKDSFQGFHIPQIIVPFNLEEKPWSRIYEQYLYYPKSKFINEVLGISYDTGGRLITLTDLRNLQELPADYTFDTYRNKYTLITAGIDWGMSASTSFTVLAILGLTQDLKIHVIEHKKYNSTDIDFIIKDISATCKQFGVKLIGADWGVGWTNNQYLRKYWCPNELSRVSEFKYSNSNKLINWNQRSYNYVVNRNNLLNLLFMALKKKEIIFKKTENVEIEIFPDILAVYEDTIESRTGQLKVFSHPADVPDDFIHALNFGYIVLRIASGQMVVSYNKEEVENE